MSGSFVAMSETMMNAAMAIASIATRTASSRSRLAKPPIVSSRENLKKPMIVSTAAPVANADATNTIGTSGELRNGTAG